MPKAKTPETSKEAEKFFQKMKDNKITVTSNTIQSMIDANKFNDYIKNQNLADESLISFLKDTNYGTKDLASYQQYLIDTGKATSTFATITAKAKDITKSLGATLASMGAMWAISEIITLIVKSIDSAVHKAENAKEEISNLQLEYESGIQNWNQKIKVQYQVIEFYHLVVYFCMLNDI